MLFRKYLINTLLLSALILTGCSKDQKPEKLEIKEILIPVAVEKLIYQPFDVILTTIGKVTSSQLVRLYFSVPGTVERIYVEQGDKLQKNMPLASLDSDQFEAQYLLAKSALVKAEKDLASTKELFKSNIVSEDQLDNVNVGYFNAKANYIQAEKAFNNTTLKAPFDGSIISRDLEIGAVVAPGAAMNPPFVLGNMEDLKILVSIAESDIGKIKTGQKVVLNFKTFPDREYIGSVLRIGLATKTLSNSFDVEIKVNNSKGDLRLGLIADVEIVIEEIKEAIVIPVDMLNELNNEMFIYTAVNGRATKTPVKIVFISGSNIVVEGNLPEGTLLITKGQHDVLEGSILTISNDKVPVE